MALESHSTIAAESAHAVNAFDHLILLLADPTCKTPELSPSTIRDDLGRFRVWAGNIGALHNPDSIASLDHRLEEAPQIHQQVSRILRRLIRSIDKASSIASGALPNRISTVQVDDSELAASDSESLSTLSDDDSNSPLIESNTMTSEIAELRKAINSTITNLFKLSMAIRRPTPRGRYAASAAMPSFDNTYDIAHVWHKFPHAREHTRLIERLGKAITRRREYFRYRREHTRKLGFAMAPSEESKTGERIPDSSGADHHRQDNAPTVTQTKATTFVVNFDFLKPPNEQEDDVSITSYATSVGENPLYALRVPRPPQKISGGMLFEYGAPFECPYCFTIQIVKNSREWKRHVFRDLQPYICTFENCTPELFAERHAWFEHELQFHRKEWRCNSCRHSPFETVQEFVQHLRNKHSGTFTEAQLFGVTQLCEVTKDKFPGTSCPLCDDWRLYSASESAENSTLFATVAQFRRHLGKHLEQLALFALPKSQDNDDNEERADSNDAIADESSTELSDVESVDSFEEEKDSTGTWRGKFKEVPSDDQDWDDPERTVVERMWGHLFSEGREPTARLGQLLRGVALFLINEITPRYTIVVTPAKMRWLYKSMRISNDYHHWHTFFKSQSNRKLSEIYTHLNCEYHLVQEDIQEVPNIPALTPEGFSRWFTIATLAFPDAEFQRLSRVLDECPINNADDIKERLPKQLSRRLFPRYANQEMQELFLKFIT